MVKTLLAAGLALAACTFDTKKFDDRACNSDADCTRPDESCVVNVCTQRSCNLDSDCGASHQFTCASGACVVEACSALADCALGFDCEGGFCQAACADHDGDGVGFGTPCSGVQDCNDADPAEAPGLKEG